MTHGWVILIQAAHVSTTNFYRIPSPKSDSYCEALYTVGLGYETQGSIW